MEKIQAYRDSAAFKDLLPIRNKVATFRSFAVEGLSEYITRPEMRLPTLGPPQLAASSLLSSFAGFRKASGLIRPIPGGEKAWR